MAELGMNIGPVSWVLLGVALGWGVGMFAGFTRYLYGLFGSVPGRRR